MAPVWLDGETTFDPNESPSHNAVTVDDRELPTVKSRYTDVCEMHKPKPRLAWRYRDVYSGEVETDRLRDEGSLGMSTCA